MALQLTVRLHDGLHKDVSVLAKRLHLRRSDIVRMALESFVRGMEEENSDTPYANVKHLLGSVSSGVSDLGESHRKYLIKKFKKNASSAS